MNIKSVNKRLQKLTGGAVAASIDKDVVTLSGKLGSWDEVVSVCGALADPRSRYHIVNDIECPEKPTPIKLPSEIDGSLEGESPDVLIIGGGISGCSIARELCRSKLSVLLVDKEHDLALGASGRNDGEIHCGVDLTKKGILKQRYVVEGNRLTKETCAELGVPFEPRGQYVGVESKLLLPLAWIYVKYMKHVCGIWDAEIIGGKELLSREPHMNKNFKFALYNRSAACVSPYELTIALAENAVQNGAKVILDTAVTGMELCGGKIVSVKTNRGTLHPKVVINAAGVYAEEIAKMAGDRFYSLHYRRGTNSILDKKSARLMGSIASIKRLGGAKHTKGGGVIRTADGNLLVGPDAVETFERENHATNKESIDNVFSKQKQTVPALSERDIITYFTGVRACTFEEDYVIEKGRNTENLVHCAGIQSPGLTTACAVAKDAAKMAVEELSEQKAVEKNDAFDPIRTPIPVVRSLSKEQRDELIKKNPDYGVIICRCEEISRGEILDALRSPICVPTVDGIKKRLRPGMGRCQGGFCMPLVAEIISEYMGIPIEQVKKSSNEAFISFGPTKGAKA